MPLSALQAPRGNAAQPGLSQALVEFRDAAEDLAQAHQRLNAAVDERSRSGRLELLGEQFARLVHQLRTPLAAALLYAAPLRNGDLPAPECGRFAGLLVERLQHMERMLAELLAYTRGPAPRCQRLPLAALPLRVQERTAPLLQAAGASLSLSSAAGEEVLILDVDAVIEALENLIDNALRASPAPARLRLWLAVESGEAVLTLADQGPGIPPELVGEVFRPFVTTRADGTGLGLPVARDRIRAQGGRLNLLPTPAGESGAWFQIRLPLSRPLTTAEDHHAQ